MKGTLNEFMSLGRPAWKEARETLIRLFSSGEGIVRDDPELWSKLVSSQVSMKDVSILSIQ